ncbi:glucuronyl esterase domain-containing protein [Auraticoccus monumenti]|uniref:4-O-methyl-glucuronoyl methylesterase-like domain-containing protein n=1 Tax=Auraticoccus monumenti TaxID=675864 RepID=A0A1G6YCI1_9ACTN|nr:hypothetical protein [Auraticoccus monumenti]SDD87306.1 hypothetical protein SAMN04489747_1945 [Auraticoccus monumenti]
MPPSDRARPTRRQLLTASAVSLGGVTLGPALGALPATAQGATPADLGGGSRRPRHTITIDGEPYPDPLHLERGTPVRRARLWETHRRAELQQLFAQHVHGTMLPRPQEQSAEVSVQQFATVVRKDLTTHVTGPFGSGSWLTRVFVPTGEVRGTFLLIDHRGAATDDPEQDTPYLPVRTINRAGYALAVFDAKEVAPDDPARYREGVIDLFSDPSAPLPPTAGRAIAAWAWAASRVMDHLSEDPDLDPARIALIGHSRSGKASLLAGGLDQRFVTVITNDSGSTGSKLARRGKGDDGRAEDVAKITSTFPHWFSEVYASYAGREEALPVDQHQLMALVAPRRLYVTSATEDANADPEGEFLAYVAAAPVYGLYGLADTGLPSTTWPPSADVPVRGPAMSYHLRTGGHGLTEVDWGWFLAGDLFD